MPEIKLSNQDIILLIKILNKEYRGLCDWIMQNYNIGEEDVCKIIGEPLQNLLTKLEEVFEDAG